MGVRYIVRVPSVLIGFVASVTRKIEGYSVFLGSVAELFVGSDHRRTSFLCNNKSQRIFLFFKGLGKLFGNYFALVPFLLWCGYEARITEC